MNRNPLLEKFRTQIKPEDKADMDATFALANRIHELLIKHGMTQRDLANKLNKKEAEVSKWLSGGHNFTISTLNRIGYAIGEPVYQPSGSSQKHVIRDVHIMISMISRTIEIKIKDGKQPIFETYPERELSELTVTSSGIINGKESRREFTEATLSPKSLRGIERFTTT